MENKTYVLVMPSMSHRAAAVEYITEFIELGDDIDGLGIDRSIAGDYDAYGEWLYWLYGEKSGNGNESEADKCESFTYFYLEEATGKIIGTVNIRKDISSVGKYGNLGYAVRPSMRGKGYGTMMVDAAVSLCGFMGMDEVTAVCLRDNKAGVRILEKSGFEIWECGKTDEERKVWFRRKLW